MKVLGELKKTKYSEKCWKHRKHLKDVSCDDHLSFYREGSGSPDVVKDLSEITVIVGASLVAHW